MPDKDKKNDAKNTPRVGVFSDATSSAPAQKRYSDDDLTKQFRDTWAEMPDSIRGLVDPKTVKVHNVSTGDNPSDVIAYVPEGDRHNIYVVQPDKVMANPRQLLGHEAVHIIQNSLAPDLASQIGKEPQGDAYNYGGDKGISDAESKKQTLLRFGREQQAAIVQHYLAQEDGYEKLKTQNPSSYTTQNQQDMKTWEADRSLYQPYIDEMKTWKTLPPDEASTPDLSSQTPNQPSSPAPSGVVTNVFHASKVMGFGEPGPLTSQSSDDPFAAYGGHAVSTTPAAASQDDPFAAFGGHQVSAPAPTGSSTQPQPASPGSEPTSDPFAAFGGRAVTPPIPENGQSPAPPSPQNESVFKKAWDWANTPLTESIGGMATARPGAGGVERALEQFASGFTSPLSIALTIGTFGTAGFLESAGASALKEAGMTAAQIADVAKGSEAVAQASKTGQSIDEAIAASGVNPKTYKDGVDLLYQSGLKGRDLTEGNLAERGSSILFRKFGLTPVQSQTAAKTMQAAVNAGFTYQQVQTAAQMSPKALDALKDGDYDHFAEYATEALASASFGALGATHAFHTAGELAEPLLGKPLRPSEQTRALSSLVDERDGQHQEINQSSRLLEEDMMHALGYKDPKTIFASKDQVASQNLRLAQMYHGITLGFDKNLAAEHFNAIAEAAGRDERLPTVSPENGQPNAALPKNLGQLIAQSDIKNKPDAYIDHVLDTYRGVYNGFTDTEMDVAKRLRNELSDGLENAQKNDLIGDGVENYLKRVWRKPNPSSNQLIQEARSGRFATNVSAARQRVFQTELEPLLKGYEYATENPISLTGQWLADSKKAIANRDLLASLMDKGTRGSDFRPAVITLGEGRPVVGSDGENPATAIDPRKARNLRISDVEVNNLKEAGHLQKFLDDGTIVDVAPKIHPDNIQSFIDRLEKKAIGAPAQYDAEGNNVLRQKIQTLKDVRDGKLPESTLDTINQQQNPVYVWKPQDYVRIDNSSFKKWNFITHDPSGDPIYIKSDLAVHPEYADYLKSRLALDDSALQKWGPTKALLKGGTKAKNLLLFGSPFHQTQEWLRGIMMGVWSNPFGAVAPSIEDSPALKTMVRHGLTLEPDYHALQESSEGVAENSKLIDKLPFGIGKAFDHYHDFLFKRYIPSLKARSGIKLFDEYKTAHPEWTDEKVAEVASKHVNDTFGGQNWRAMGRSATTQDWARLMLLAPDWLESEARSIARVFNPEEGSIARRQFGQLALGMWGVARVLNMVATGNPHYEAPFGLSLRNKDGRDIVYSVRTLPTDLLHAATDPVGFLKGRLSPAVHTGVELATSRDQMGRKLSPGDMAWDIGRSILPIPAQALGQELTGGGPQVGNSGQFARAAGITATVYKTEAQKLAAQLASDHSESGPIDPSMMHRHRVLMDFEDKLRSGQMALPQIYQMVVQGDLSESDAKKISMNLKQTKEMSPEMASLYTRASRLPAPELLKVWDTATLSEKVALNPLIAKTRKLYLKKAMTNETPRERLQDPILKRLLAIHPTESPF